MKSSLGIVIALALALLSACTRARVTTEIGPGGVSTRSVALTGQVKKEGGMDMGGGAITDSFVLPSGPRWKSHVDTKESDQTTTFVTAVPIGQLLKGDLSVKGDGANGLSLVNEMTVTRVGPRRFEYKETLRWIGAPPEGSGLKPEDIAKLKALLPKDLATDENAQGLSGKMADLLMPALFGPGDPLLAIALLHPDLAARRLSQRVGSLLLKALEEQFGDKLTLAQRREIGRKLIEASSAGAKPAAPDPSAGPPSASKSGGGLTPLMFIVKSPGKVVSSNGEVDELTGEVYWALFPPAAALKPVVLTAVVQLER